MPSPFPDQDRELCTGGFPPKNIFLNLVKQDVTFFLVADDARWQKFVFRNCRAEGFFLQGGKVFSDTSLESFDYLLSYHANPMSLLFKYNDDGDDDGGAEDNDDDNEDHGVAVGVGRHRLVTAD